MRDELGFGGQPGVLTPSVPRDIGARSQRQRILEAMAQSCAEKSFSATTIADVVGAASISRATFYKHFANKRECLSSALGSFVDELGTAAVDAQEEVGSSADATRNALAAILQRMAEKPAYAKLAVIEAPILEPAAVVKYRQLAIDAMKGQWGGESKPGGADPSISFGRVHVLVADYLATGRARQLPELLPEALYTILLPFLGHGGALAQVELAR